MNVKLREFKPSDKDKVIKLVEASYDKYVDGDFSEEGRVYWLDDLYDEGLNQSLHHSRIIVAEIEKTLVGVVRLQMHHRITMLYVNDQYFRMGIGRTLLIKVINIAKEYGAEEVELNSSLYAIKFYEHFGFAKVGKLSKKFGVVSQNMILSMK